MLVRTGDVQWTDIWDIVGLRGTASDQFALTDHFVPHDHRFTRDFAQPAQRAPRAGAALPHVGDDLLRDRLRRRGAGHRPRRARRVSSIPPGPRSRAAPRARSATAPWSRPASPRPRSACARRAPGCCSRWPGSGSASRPATTSSVEDRIVIRGASTNAIHKAREAVDFAYNAAGATAIFGSHPLERRFRDIHTVTQQLQGRLEPFRNRRRLDDGRRYRSNLGLREHSMPLGVLQHYTHRAVQPRERPRTSIARCWVSRTATVRRSASPATGSIPAASRPCICWASASRARASSCAAPTKKFEDTGRFDHIAFAATDIDGVRKRLKAKKVKFREQIDAAHRCHADLPLRSRRRRRGAEFPAARSPLSHAVHRGDVAVIRRRRDMTYRRRASMTPPSRITRHLPRFAGGGI